jgi:hypothetical protein
VSYALVIAACDGQPKNFPPGTYNEIDVYPAAKAGDVVIVVNSGYDYAGRPLYQCSRQPDAAVQFIYASYLIGMRPTSLDSDGMPTTPLPHSGNLISR